MILKILLKNMFKKIFWRIKIIFLSLDKIILVFFFEFRKYFWMYIFDYIIFMSEVCYLKLIYYLKKYFWVIEFIDGFFVDFNKFLMFFIKDEWSDEKLFVVLFFFYFDLIYI